SLRAVTDKVLLKRSIGSLASGGAIGAVGGWLIDKVPFIAASGLSMSNVGGGMIVGSRITIPAFVMGAIGFALTPWLRANGWLGAHEPFRRLGFLVGLAGVMGAAGGDLTLIAPQALAPAREPGAPPASERPGAKGPG